MWYLTDAADNYDKAADWDPAIELAKWVLKDPLSWRWFAGAVALPWTLVYDMAIRIPAVIAKDGANALRMGDGLRKGTVWGVVEDGLRVLTLLGPVARVGRLASAALVAQDASGVQCGLFATARIARLSGARFFASVSSLYSPGIRRAIPWTARILDRLGPGMRPLSKMRMAELASETLGVAAKGGTTLEHDLGVLQRIGLRVQPIVSGEKATEAAIADATRGGVVEFAIRWTASPVQSAGHRMLAYRGAFGRLLFVDPTFANTGASIAEALLKGGGRAPFQVTKYAVVENATVLEEYMKLSAGSSVLSLIGTEVNVGLVKMRGPGDAQVHVLNNGVTYNVQDGKLQKPAADEKQHGDKPQNLHPTGKPRDDKPQDSQPVEKPHDDTPQQPAPAEKPHADKPQKPDPIEKHQVNGATVTRYRVQPGDSPSLIAQRIFHNWRMWDVIYQANTDLLGPDPKKPRLRVGQVLVIPQPQAGITVLPPKG